MQTLHTMDPKDTTDLANIRAAFRAARKAHGIKARANFMCCGSCAAAELGSNYIFWHRQAHDAFDRYGDLRGTLYIQHAHDINTQAVVETLQAYLAGTGLVVAWNGHLHTCISIERAH